MLRSCCTALAPPVKESFDLLSMALASEPLTRHVARQCSEPCGAIAPHVWSGKLVGAMVITFIVQGVTIGAYAARLAGVQTKRIATSISLFNLFVTTGRLANLFMAFFVGPLADEAGNASVDSVRSHGSRCVAASSSRPSCG